MSACPELPDVRNSIAVFQGSQTLPASTDKDSLNKKINVEHSWNVNAREKPNTSKKTLP